MQDGLVGREGHCSSAPRREEGGPAWLWADGRERHVGGRMEPRESGLSPSIRAGLPPAPVGVSGAGGWGHWDKEGEC